MSDRPVIRLFRFRPALVEFDKTLRTIMVPDLRRMDGLIDVHVGRHGAEQLGDRIVATIWTDRPSMKRRSGRRWRTRRSIPIGCPTRRASSSRSASSTSCSGSRAGRRRRSSACSAARSSPGELAAYIEEARAGTLADVEAQRGPAALYLAADPPDRFLTLSLWPDWSAIERATGGDVHRPMSTKDSARIVDMDIVHYEVVTDAT